MTIRAIARRLPVVADIPRRLRDVLRDMRINVSVIKYNIVTIFYTVHMF